MKAFILSLAFFASTTQAAVLQNGPEEAKHYGVQVYSKTNFDVKGTTGEMNLVNWALRAAMGGAIQVGVYEFFLSDLNSFARDEDKALESLSTQPAVAMRITYVGSFTSEQMYPRVKAVIVANEMQNDPVVIELMKIYENMDVQRGQVTEYLLYKNTDGTESLVFVDATGKSHRYSGPAGLMTTIFKLWLGKTLDADAAKTKTHLIMGGAQ